MTGLSRVMTLSTITIPRVHRITRADPRAIEKAGSIGHERGTVPIEILAPTIFMQSRGGDHR